MERAGLARVSLGRLCSHAAGPEGRRSSDGIRLRRALWFNVPGRDNPAGRIVSR